MARKRAEYGGRGGGFSSVKPSIITRSQYVAPRAAAAGYYAKYSSITTFSSSEATTLSAYSQCKGVQVGYLWSTLEPSPGAWDFSTVFTGYERARSIGKQFAMLVSFASGDPGQSNLATPSWYFDHAGDWMGGYTSLVGTAYPRWPHFNDNVYIYRVTLLCQALMRYMDNLASYIRFAPWGVGTGEPTWYQSTAADLTAMDSDGKRHNYAKRSSDGKWLLNTASPYYVGTARMIAAIDPFFTRCQPAASYNANNNTNDNQYGYDTAFIALLQQYRWIILNNGANEADKSDVRDDFVDWRATYGMRVGYGSISGLGTHGTGLTGLDLRQRMVDECFGVSPTYTPEVAGALFVGEPDPLLYTYGDAVTSMASRIDARGG